MTTAWQKNHDANIYLLRQIPAEALMDRYSERTRTVAAQFAHIHNVRVYQLEKRGKEMLGRLQGFERGAQPGRKTLVETLNRSSAAIANLLVMCGQGNKVKGWHGTPASWLAYLVAHEAHHRALALVSLRMSKRKLPEELKYNIWNWGKKGGIL